MEKVSQNILLVLGGLVLGVASFYLYAQAQTSSEDVTVTVGDAFAISSTAPGTLAVNPVTDPLSDTFASDASSDITFSAASSSGVKITIGVEDLDTTDDSLCENNGSDACTANVFTTDGSSSELHYTTSETSGTELSGGTLITSQALVDAGGAGTDNVYTESGTVNYTDEGVTVDLDAGIDYTIVATSYEGTVTFTISTAS